MIVGIGIDAVEIERFQTWKQFSKKQLERIFTLKEISYAFENKNKTAERLAVRFAAREAFYKAFSYFDPEHTFAFLTLCKNVSILNENRRAPKLAVNWNYVKKHSKKELNNIDTLISLTHTKTVATAYIILAKQ